MTYIVSYFSISVKILEYLALYKKKEIFLCREIECVIIFLGGLILVTEIKESTIYIH
jgi:hypothetical protein